jgi:hypothetical protein
LLEKNKTITDKDKELVAQTNKIRNLEVDLTVKEKLLLKKCGKSKILEEKIVVKASNDHGTICSVDKTSNDSLVKQKKQRNKKNWKNKDV